MAIRHAPSIAAEIQRQAPPPVIPALTETERGALGNARLQDLFHGICQTLRPKAFLDVGANDGSASRAVREKCPNCVIHAFEANPAIHGRHAAALDAQGIRLWNLAVSNQAGPTKIYAPLTLSRAYRDGDIVESAVTELPDTGKTSLLLRDEDATYQEYTVEAVTLDAFAANHLPPLDGRSAILWIDVEGAADRVIDGATTLLDHCSALFLEMECFPFWKDQADRGAIVAALRKRGFLPLARDREYGDLQHNSIFVHESRLFDLLPLCLDGPSDIRPLSFTGPRLPRASSKVEARDIPVLIPAFNTVTYVRDMVRQLRERGFRRIRIIDNASTFRPMLEFLDDPGPDVAVTRLAGNHGPRHVFDNEAIFAELPEFFCVTDPDLLLNPEMPPDFVQTLVDATEFYGVGKAGLALDIHDPASLRQEDFTIGGSSWKIWEWEAQFWKRKVGTTAGDDPIYDADIDTTFALYNKKFFANDAFFKAVRIAGRFTARHRPWYPSTDLPPDELEFYRETARNSFYIGAPAVADAAQVHDAPERTEKAA